MSTWPFSARRHPIRRSLASDDCQRAQCCDLSRTAGDGGAINQRRELHSDTAVAAPRQPAAHTPRLIALIPAPLEVPWRRRLRATNGTREAGGPAAPPQSPSGAIGIGEHPTFGSSYLIRDAGVELNESLLRSVGERTACEEDSVSPIASLDHEEMLAVARRNL